MSPYSDPIVRRQKGTERMRTWRAKNPERVSEIKRKGYAKLSDREKRNLTLRRYGMSIDDYDALLESQNGGCAICGADDPRSRGSRFDAFYVDHCHETGTVRGLLCSNCNTGIGYLGDNFEGVAAAAEYLARYWEPNT